MRVELFIDPVSGWSWWTPALLVEDDPPSRPGARGGSAAGRVGAWFGICEQTPSGVWQRVHVARRDPWEPGAQGSHSTVWSWWCR